MTAQYPGSRWWRFDLHNHTTASSDYKGDRSITARDWLLNYMRAGIDALAITDHNTAAGIGPVLSALAELDALAPNEKSTVGYRSLVVFPGVELTTAEGLHTLAIFDPSTGAEAVQRLLGAVQCPDQSNNHETMCPRSAADALQAIHDAGGIAIAAHIDCACGLFEARSTQEPAALKHGERVREQVLALLHAVQVVDLDAPQLQSALPKLRERIAIVHASDAHKPKDVGHGSAWIKCTTPNLSGLKLALLDYTLAVRSPATDARPDPPPAAWITGVSISELKINREHRLDLRLNPGLNTLIGGRGTGKSSVIESIRLASQRAGSLDALDTNSEVRKSFQRFAGDLRSRIPGGLLTERTQLVIGYARDDEKFHLSFDMTGQRALATRVLADGTKEALQLTPDQVAERFPVRILSQKQVYELSDSPRALLQLLDADPRVGKARWQAKFDALAQELRVLRTELRHKQSRVTQIGLKEDRWTQIDRQLKAMEQSHTGDRLRNYQRAISQNNALIDAIRLMRTWLDERKLGLEPSPPELRPSGLDETAATDVALLNMIRETTVLVERAHEDAKSALVRAEHALQNLQSEIADSDWQKAVTAALGDYDQLVEELKSHGIRNPKEYGQLLLEKQGLDSELKALRAEQAELSALERRIAVLHRELLDHRLELTASRRQFIESEINSSGLIRLQLSALGDRDSAVQTLREILVLDGDSFREDIFVETEKGGIGVVADLYADAEQISENWLRLQQDMTALRPVVLATALSSRLQTRLTQRTPPAQLDALLLGFPEDALDFRYRQENKFKSLQQGSAGQRSAAVLSFLLAFGDEPLVLDQPEDDLDNELVFDLVVSGVRENKLRRQLIIATHNANIVVNGDADYVVPMAFRGGRINIDGDDAGGLQDERVRRRICKIMEGGEKAFEMRYKKVLKDLR